jgi:hypothetical protein
VTLREHDAGLQAVLELDQLVDLATAVEAVLASGKVPWRPYKSYRSKGRPKVPPVK